MSKFNLKITPALTLSDTKFEVEGSVTGNVYGKETKNGTTIYDYAQLAKSWVDKYHPEWGDSWGVSSQLLPSILKPRLADAEVHLIPRALAHHVFDNSDSQIPSRYTAELSNTITNSSTVEWDESATATYTVGIEVGEGPVKATSGFSFSATVGHSTSYSKTVEIGSKDSVDVDVPPGLVELAVLFLKQGVITVAINLDWIIQGHIVISDPHNNIMVVDAKDLQQFSLNPRQSRASLTLEFAGESEIRTVTIPDSSPASVDEAIINILQPFNKSTI